jgi:very-short-patch-repair endonuclease
MTDDSTPVIVRDIPDAKATDRARSLRADASMPERVLWNRLRAGRLKGLKFRRQQPLFGYTLDFYCHAARLAVEIDGDAHGARRERDAARDALLAKNGVVTLRIPASEVSRDIDRVLEWIFRAARERSET